jgi:hypothetical protein
MDEKQATNFILNRLNLGHDINIISDDLSKLLGVPSDIVMRFVNKIAASHTPPPGSFSKTPPYKSAPPFSTDVLITEPSSDLNEDTNQGPDDDFQYPDSQTEAEQETLQPSKEKLRAPFQHQESLPISNIDLDELKAFVIKSLKKHIRHNDIIEEVCQRAQWNWNESQRFVARTQTEQHSQLTKSRLSFMVPFSVIFILGGIFLLFWSGLTLYDYYLGFTNPEYSTLSLDFLPLVLGGLVTGFGIIAGGIFGLYRSLSNQ